MSKVDVIGLGNSLKVIYDALKLSELFGFIQLPQCSGQSRDGGGDAAPHPTKIPNTSRTASLWRHLVVQQLQHFLSGDLQHRSWEAVQDLLDLILVLLPISLLPPRPPLVGLQPGKGLRQEAREGGAGRRLQGGDWQERRHCRNLLLDLDSEAERFCT